MKLDQMFLDLYTKALKIPPCGDEVLVYGKVRESRLDGHIRRLVDERTPIEWDFAQAVESQWSGVTFPDQAQTIIHGQDEDTTLYWTVAPYVYEALTQSGDTASEALERMVNWANSTPKGKSEWGVHLPWLEGLNDVSGGFKSFVLSRNPTDATHEAAQVLGSYVAHLLKPRK